ncbi:DUF808 domain-containing protein [Falsirhodobacter sp. alg1]|uniref:DUF808 domain-containing protein n=1 Tax=Falsirhodobacter sp. alg1 TaxID=1472418 RepID=UPI0005EFA059|nr:DUF808 domain-containing protein [Falsirhodobacter sp. alg1]
MSGLLALLDDVAGLAKVAAASIDDVAAAAGKAGTKATTLVIDDAAVTPKYVTGLPASRELPMIWRIAVGSVRNKLLILLPILLIFQAFLPWIITPLLMIGGAYLCFEGAEKIIHAAMPHAEPAAKPAPPKDPARLEEQKVAGAIKTDFILSAEIMTIALSQIEGDSLWVEAAALVLVGIMITALVYGAVALIVRTDDVGLRMVETSGSAVLRKAGALLVRGMPVFLKVLTVIGTLAMLWVGGNILTHGLHEMGWHNPYELIHHWAAASAGAIGVAHGFVEWFVAAFCDGVIGLAVGAVLVVGYSRVISPLLGKKAAH